MTSDIKKLERSEYHLERAKPILMRMWSNLMPGYMPDDVQWNLWLNLHDITTVKIGITRTAKKKKTLQNKMNDDYAVRFASSVMNNITQHQVSRCSKEQSQV